MSEKKEKPPVRHRVLYQDGRPVMSREVGDPDAREDFGAYRLDAINKAREAGATRPKFEDRLEEGGKPVKEGAA